MFDIPFPERLAAAKFQLNPVILRLSLKELQRRGGSPEAVCADLGFRPDELESPGFVITYLQANQAFRRMVDEVKDPTFGFSVGMRFHFASWGLVGLGAMAAGTLSEAILFALEFQLQAGSMLQISLEFHGEQISLVATPRFADVAIEAHLADGTFASLIKAARQMLGTTFNPLAVELIARKPMDSHPYQQFFQCPVRFGCHKNRMIFGNDWGLQGLPTGDAFALKQITTTLHGLPSTVMKVANFEATIDTRLQSNLRTPPPLGDLALALNMSERNLRRKLAESGRSYLEMLDQARKTRVLQRLVHTQRTTREIAEEVGFSDPRSLRRAFKRWTGESLSGIKLVNQRLGLSLSRRHACRVAWAFFNRIDIT